MMVKLLHGSIATIAAPESLLSVTSMNQLVHNTSFTVTESAISSIFHNIFPLLKEMNK